MGEDVVLSFERLVTTKTVLERRFVCGLAICRVREPPAAGRGVLLGVFDHELNVRRGTSNKRLGAAEGLVVYLRRNILPMYCCNDRAVGEWQCSFPIGLYRNVIPQLGA